MRPEPVFQMTIEEDIQATIEALKRPRTPEQARQNLIDAGIIDENGEPTEPYQELYAWIRQKAA